MSGFKDFMRKQPDIVDKKNTAVIVLCIAAVFCFCCGFGYLTVSVLHPLIKSNKAKKWPTTKCKILESNVESCKMVGRHSRRIAYRIFIQYEYEYGGEKYHSDKYDFLDTIFDDYKTAKKITNEFKLNNNYECFVNPDSPAEAVLRTKL
ncbi:MAG TPA: DUF3592 domain-containing protein [Sedimentisphaerales bacterium]|nr:DUF3592 domain-containing protein [Sedimentisphaerales bacterium]